MIQWTIDESRGNYQKTVSTQNILQACEEGGSVVAMECDVVCCYSASWDVCWLALWAAQFRVGFEEWHHLHWTQSIHESHVRYAMLKTLNKHSSNQTLQGCNQKASISCVCLVGVYELVCNQLTLSECRQDALGGLVLCTQSQYMPLLSDCLADKTDGQGTQIQIDTDTDTDTDPDTDPDTDTDTYTSRYRSRHRYRHRYRYIHRCTPAACPLLFPQW